MSKVHFSEESKHTHTHLTREMGSETPTNLQAMAIDLRVAIIEGKVIAPVACSQPADSNREWAKSSCLQAAILFFNTGSLKVKGRTELCLFVTGGLKRQANASRGRTVGVS